MNISSPHSFHIPVMGLAFTIDSPIKVAHYGITSVISIMEDNLIEVMRKYYYQQNGQSYFPISTKEPDYRAKRITDYLNFINRIVHAKVAKLKSSTFEVGSDIVKYYKMLPDNSELKIYFNEMLNTPDHHKKNLMQQLLRDQVKPGSIEVNIMTKLDKDNFDNKGEVLKDGSDAVSALRGYAQSALTNSSIVFSAGLNPRLYNYLEKFPEFDAKGWGVFDKKVIIKVSDYRSALIQGKYLAKKGIWVSEFRIESGLNCGGHAFATDGLLLGPILQEFKEKREELSAALFNVYKPAVEEKGKQAFDKPHPIRITVQGGIGTAEEDNFLRNYYEVDGTGWGTPFLLCPEATTVDDPTLNLLSSSGSKDVVLSHNSPIGVRFNYLKGTSSEKERLNRIDKGSPGSPCTEKYLSFNTEFTEKPICTASKKYQKLKIEQLQSLDLSEKEYAKQEDRVLSKECLCIGLSNSAPAKYEFPFVKKLEAVTICPGPNIAWFSDIVSLKEMTDHIYGRRSVLNNKKRPHMFVKELELYKDFLYELEDELSADDKAYKHALKFCDNLMDGINYYQDLVRNNLQEFSAAPAIQAVLISSRIELQELKDKISLAKEEIN
ncbi:MAG: hypothetical protein ACNS60_11355 [Candidatus Cyclobacteriaceae bacterium M2_1C_046]